MKLIKIVALIGLLSIGFSSSAIVIRDDVEDSKYLAKNSDFPALATFYIDGAHGTLIKPRWVITAAHASFCVKTDTYVQINGKARKVANVFVHPDYTPGQSHDIALVSLVEEVKDVKPAKLYLSQDEIGKDIWFIGIGGTGNGITGQTVDNAENLGVLRKAQNKITAAEGPLIKFLFDKGNNALPLEGVSGGGDSGGPAYLVNDKETYLLGISSRLENGGIGEYGITEIYSRISYFQTWIDQVISGNEVSRKEITIPKLATLPAGLSEDILPMVCNDIGLNQASKNVVRSAN